MLGPLVRRRAVLLDVWRASGGPGRLERWTARRPGRSALVKGGLLGMLLAVAGVADEIGWVTAAMVIAGYTVWAYLEGQQYRFALDDYRDAARRGPGISTPPASAELPSPPHTARLAAPADPTLRLVFWREEILELVLWLRGEGMDEHLDSLTVSRFLGLTVNEAGDYVRHLAAEGLLKRVPDGRYQLDVAGEQEAQRLIRGSRSTPPPRPGPCGAVCWCGISDAEAIVCDTASQHREVR